MTVGTRRKKSRVRLRLKSRWEHAKSITRTKLRMFCSRSRPIHIDASRVLYAPARRDPDIDE